MESAPPRGAEGLRPYARAKTRAASRLAVAGYPFRKFGDDLKRATKVTSRNAHDESEQIPSGSTSEAIKNLFLRVNVERGMALAVYWTEAHELAAGLT
jgi:hypothetical protein